MIELPYIELHCHSAFSLLNGASSPEALARQAAALGMPALALTDHNSLAGAVRFVAAAQEAGVQPILGAELTLHDDAHLTLLVENDRGWRNLCALISLAQHHAPKGSARLPPDVLHAHAAGLLALSGCGKSRIASAVRTGDRAAALSAAHDLIASFGRDRCFVEVQHHLQPGDTAHVADLAALAAHVHLPIVATNNVHYATRRERALYDVLTCIRHHTTLDQAGSLLSANSERYLKPGGKLAPLFAAYPRALSITTEIAARCTFELQFGIQDLPQFPTPPGLHAAAYLHDLCLHALPQRYDGDAVPHARTQLDHELQVIDRMGLANYFLIVHDLVRFARDSGIRCQGRGSAANSLVAYLLGISPIDPLAHDLVFERFLAEGQAVLPDIDIDFAADRREEVIQYVYERYGTDHAAMACTLVTFRSRSAARDIGKVVKRQLEEIAGVN
ncbi:MAG: PHP domain-containing protein [Chloroflexota bacterium]|nr:PHP domain-containing protein [Chloroflexota bacterium]